MPEPDEVSTPAEPVGEIVRGLFDDEHSDTGTAPWMTLAEAGAIVGVSSKAIRRAVKAGIIRGRRVSDSQNARWLVHLEDVETWWGDEASVPEAEASERDSRSEIEDDREQGRLSKLRERLVIEEPERRWWQRNR